MELYKYTSIKNAINILENFEIRFTQPNALNDVYDMFPNFLTEISKETFLLFYNDSIREGIYDKLWNEIDNEFYNYLNCKPGITNSFTKEFSDLLLRKIFQKIYLRGRDLSDVVYDVVKKRE